jgi:hypothetical protein
VDEKKPKTKIERRDGKLFVAREKQPYVQGMIRSFFVSAKKTVSPAGSEQTTDAFERYNKSV